MNKEQIKEEASKKFYNICSEGNINITSVTEPDTYTDNPVLSMIHFVHSQIDKAFEEGKKEGREQTLIDYNRY